ncbi:transmembrane protein 56-like [Papaver somniferum]|uniref:transmembrane protein 56-like n=1 Tax=Papaver somniferum TaxID=3469 RepID=UPI000E6FC25B|nr:transmembrane protein 56-like [Papaver somniferum]XP_026424154.1 transmembrane protein 56-like [Papaver somniferum]
MDVISLRDSVSSRWDYLLAVSMLAGIIMCKIVYEVTGLVSLLLFKGYSGLSKAHKIEWKNRGFSTFHAFVVTIAAFYLVLFSDLFVDGSSDVSIVKRNSTLSNTILGISIGYFVTDLSMILWLFPALGGLEYVLHHGLSMFSILLSLISGEGQIYILMVLFSECTTPLVNLRWYLDLAGQKGSKLYMFNGSAMFLSWLVGRIFLFIYLFVHMFLHFDEVKEIFPLGFYSLFAVPPVLSVMNAYWFWKILKGLIKTLSKARHSHSQ